jgi:ribose 5-phosphate isomerase B
MKVYLATDHAGFELKEIVKKYLTENNFIVEDMGAFSFDSNDDYPDFISLAAEKVSQNPEENMGIIFGKSGAGEAIVANKFKGVRCVQGFLEENVKLSREHNNANILSLGSQFVSFEAAKKLSEIFLKTPFSGDERHVRRLNKLTEIEHKNYA